MGPYIDKKLGGVIATKDKSHIALFFVGKDFQNKRVGRPCLIT